MYALGYHPRRLALKMKMLIQSKNIWRSYDECSSTNRTKTFHSILWSDPVALSIWKNNFPYQEVTFPAYISPTIYLVTIHRFESIIALEEQPKKKSLSGILCGLFIFEDFASGCRTFRPITPVRLRVPPGVQKFIFISADAIKLFA